MENDQVYSQHWHSQKSLFKHFQGYLGMFWYIDAYLARHIGEQLVRVGEASPIHSLKLKKFHNFGKGRP